MAAKEKKDAKVKRPYRPSGYQLWATARRAELKESDPEVKGKEIMARLGQEWNVVAEEDKEKWREQSKNTPYTNVEPAPDADAHPAPVAPSPVAPSPVPSPVAPKPVVANDEPVVAGDETIKKKKKKRKSDGEALGEGVLTSVPFPIAHIPSS